MTPIITGTTEDLAAAQAAYRSLLLGQQARVIVDMNGERVEFTASKKGDLYAYILALQQYLTPSTVPGCNGPAGFLF